MLFSKRTHSISGRINYRMVGIGSTVGSRAAPSWNVRRPLSLLSRRGSWLWAAILISAAKHTIDETRCRLDPETASDCIFCSENLELLSKDLRHNLYCDSSGKDSYGDSFDSQLNRSAGSSLAPSDKIRVLNSQVISSIWPPIWMLIARIRLPPILFASSPSCMRLHPLAGEGIRTFGWHAGWRPIMHVETVEYLPTHEKYVAQVIRYVN